MITLLRGPGGALRRLAAELVPLGCAGLALGLTLPLASTLPLVVAIAAVAITFLLTWVVVSWILRRVRERTRLRVLYRVALCAHVLFWSAQGVLATANHEAGPLQAAGAGGWREPTAFRAGVGEALFDLPARTPLAGWGSKPRRITAPPFAGLGVVGRLGQRIMAAPLEDRGPTVPMFRASEVTAASQGLGARALVLRPEDPQQGPPMAFVRVDLVTSDRDLTAAVAAGVEDLGYRPETVLVAATHTHSGPGGYSRVPVSALVGTDHFDAEVFAAITRTCVQAVRAAHEQARPARIGLVRALDRDGGGARIVSRNRRLEDPNAIDDRVYALRVDEREGGAAIGVLLNYAVHPVVMRRRHMRFDRDLAGALEDAVRDALPGAPLVLFVNGAQGDVSPEDVPDLEGAERARHLAARFAREAFRPAWERTDLAGGDLLRVAAARTRRRMATPRIVMGTGSREAQLDALHGALWEGDAGALAANAIALPVNAFAWSLGLPELRVGFGWSGAVGVSVNLESGVGSDPYDFGAFLFETGGARPQRWALLWEPAEATQAVGAAWRAEVARLGIPDTLVVGLAGGSTAYVTTEDEFHRDGYEAEATLFGPRAAGDVTEALLDALLRAADAR